jgi:hypothetical protein
MEKEKEDKASAANSSSLEPPVNLGEVETTKYKKKKVSLVA